MDVKVVFGKNFLGDGSGQNADIMVEVKWGAKVEVFNVEGEVASSFMCVGDSTVDMYF